jgi:two-component system response regulator (stage 0 sporulation protein F)
MSPVWVTRPAATLAAMDGQGQAAIIVADDDPSLRLLCRVNLELDGYRVFEAADAAELERLVSSESVDGILLDIRFGASDGVELSRRLRERHPEVRVAFLSGSLDRGQEGPAEGFLAKPFTLEALAATVQRLVRSSARRS